MNNRQEPARCIHFDLNKIKPWSNLWLVTFSPPKTKALTISNNRDRHENPQIYFNNIPIDEVNTHCYLGLTFSYNLKWNAHIDNVTVKASQRTNMMIPLKYKLDKTSLQTMYLTFVRPVMEYGISVWGGTYDSNIVKLERVQIDALRIITGATQRSNIANLYAEVNIPTFMERRDTQMLMMMFKVKNNITPSSLSDLLPNDHPVEHNYNLRRENHMNNPIPRLESTSRSFMYYAKNLWNNLSQNFKNTQSISVFKKGIQNLKEQNVLYYYGKRWCNVHHSRIRMGCSKLNEDLCQNLHVKDSPTCACGSNTETAKHYFMDCPLFIDERRNLVNTVTQITEFKLNTLLHGCPDLILQSNKHVFDAVHRYLKDTKRFE